MIRQETQEIEASEKLVGFHIFLASRVVRVDTHKVGLIRKRLKSPMDEVTRTMLKTNFNNIKYKCRRCRFPISVEH